MQTAAVKGKMEVPFSLKSKEFNPKCGTLMSIIIMSTGCAFISLFYTYTVGLTDLSHHRTL